MTDHDKDRAATVGSAECHGLSTAERLDRIESRIAIRELLTAYCLACDDRDMEGLRSLFTADVRFRSPSVGMYADGVDDAIAMFNALFRIRGPGFHWTHDLILKFDPTDQDAATGVVLSHAETTPNGEASIAGIRYEDCYRRVGGTWKFSERVLKFLYYVPMREYVAHFPSRSRIGIKDGRWLEADVPETLETWKRWHAEHKPD